MGRIEGWWVGNVLTIRWCSVCLCEKCCRSRISRLVINVHYVTYIWLSVRERTTCIGGSGFDQTDVILLLGLMLCRQKGYIQTEDLMLCLFSQLDLSHCYGYNQMYTQMRTGHCSIVVDFMKM